MAKKAKDVQYYEGVGRRKEAVARVRLYLVNKDKIASIKDSKIKQGEIYINNKPFESLFSSAVEQARIIYPFSLTKNENRFATSIYVTGGGKTGQLEAIINGLARAIEAIDTNAFRSVLKKKGLLTRDARTRQRRMVGKGGKARRQKQSPKR